MWNLRTSAQNPQLYSCVVKLPTAAKTHRNRAKAFIQLRKTWHWSVRVEAYTHVELTADRVVELIGVDDVGRIVAEVTGDRCRDATKVCTPSQKNIMCGLTHYTLLACEFLTGAFEPRPHLVRQGTFRIERPLCVVAFEQDVELPEQGARAILPRAHRR